MRKAVILVLSGKQLINCFLKNKTLPGIKMQSCYDYGCNNHSGSSRNILFLRLPTKNETL